MTETKENEKKTPAFVIYEVNKRGDKTYWNRVGAAFKHGKGEGCNLVYNNGARNVLMPPKAKDAATEAETETA